MGKSQFLVLWAGRKSWQLEKFTFSSHLEENLFTEISEGGEAASLSLNCSTCPSGLKSVATGGCWT